MHVPAASCRGSPPSRQLPPMPGAAGAPLEGTVAGTGIAWTGRCTTPRRRISGRAPTPATAPFGIFSCTSTFSRSARPATGSVRTSTRCSLGTRISNSLTLTWAPRPRSSAAPPPPTINAGATVGSRCTHVHSLALPCGRPRSLADNFLYVNGVVWSSVHGHAFYSHWKDSHVIDTLKIPTGHW